MNSAYYWDFFAFGVLLSATCLIFSVKAHGINCFKSPIFFSSFLFVVTFYIPIYFLPANYPWYHFSFVTVQVVVISNICVLLGHLLANYLLPTKGVINYGSRLDKLLYIPSNMMLMVVWWVGVAIYLCLFLLKGIPVLSGNVDFTRQEFLSGSGFIVQPAKICINFSILSFVIKRHYKLAFIFGVVGLAITMMSGWRGNMITVTLGIMMILAYQNRVTGKVILYTVFGALMVAFAGIYRASLSDKSIYGLSLDQSANFFDIIISSFLYFVLRLGIHADTLNDVLLAFQSYRLGGEAILMDLLGVFGGGENTVVYYLKEKMADWEGGGGLPPTMFGAFYMDFGLLGVISLSFITAVIYSLFSNYFSIKSRNNKFYLLFLAALGSAWFTAFLGTFFKYFLSIMLFHTIAYVGLCVAFMFFLRSRRIV